jgi:hypothetical protein
MVENPALQGEKEVVNWLTEEFTVLAQGCRQQNLEPHEWFMAALEAEIKILPPTPPKIGNDEEGHEWFSQALHWAEVEHVLVPAKASSNHADWFASAMDEFVPSSTSCPPQISNRHADWFAGAMDEFVPQPFPNVFNIENEGRFTHANWFDVTEEKKKTEAHEWFTTALNERAIRAPTSARPLNRKDDYEWFTQVLRWAKSRDKAAVSATANSVAFPKGTSDWFAEAMDEFAPNTFPVSYLNSKDEFHKPGWFASMSPKPIDKKHQIASKPVWTMKDLNPHEWFAQALEVL